MTYIDYQDCIKEIGISLAFESYKGLSGNSNVTDMSKALSEINPLNHKEVDSNGRTKSNLPRVTKEMMIALSQENKKK